MLEDALGKLSAVELLTLSEKRWMKTLDESKQEVKCEPYLQKKKKYSEGLCGLSEEISFLCALLQRL